MIVKLAGRLPAGEANGLLAVHDRLCDTGKDPVVVVAVLGRRKVEIDRDTAEVTPTARICHIEAIIDPGDAQELLRLMLRERERRTGKAVLPLELEHELRQILDSRGEDPPTPAES
jgi:hypothetical protein